MQVAAKLEDVAFSGRIAGQAHTVAATPQDRPLYEVMSAILSNYHHIRNGTDIGASETMQRWAWSDYHIILVTLAHVHKSACIKNICQIIAGISHFYRLLPHLASCGQE